MPLHEYECVQCKRRLEKIQKFSDAPLTVCPHCGGRLEQMLHAPALSFKGGGWYADLYSSAKPSGSSEAKAEGGAPAGGSADSAPGSPPKDSGGSGGKDSSSQSGSAPSAAPAAPASTSSDKK